MLVCFSAAVIQCWCDLTLLTVDYCSYQPFSLIHVTNNTPPPMFSLLFLLNNHHCQLPVSQHPLFFFSASFSQSLHLLIPTLHQPTPLPPSPPFHLLCLAPSFSFCHSLSAGLLAGMGCVPSSMCAPEWKNALCSHLLLPLSPLYSFLLSLWFLYFLLTTGSFSAVIWRA